MDNWYNSVELSEALLAQKIHTVCTLRCNRGEPSEIRNAKRLSRHDVIARDNGKVMVLAWQDKQIVKAITTKHNNGFITMQRRKEGRAKWKLFKNLVVFAITTNTCQVLTDWIK